ncbi:MAG TPA: neutral zinc metallopeptidase, partial [Bryobacteraceae bacterium]|nr:neutral zinc metallopeptidase [Bryobacteraceae bacterium]
RVSGNIEDRRGFGGGGARIGLGGMLVLLVLSLIFGRDFLSMVGDSGPAQGVTEADRSAGEDKQVQFVSFVLDDAQDTWRRILPGYRDARLVLFRNEVQSACGFAQSATGPFYCPGDQRVYLDLGFFDELQQRFGAPGDFAQAYVIAHELGHHVQRQLGLDRGAPVAVELQADCLAGVWGHSTAQRDILEQGDVEEGLNAAASIGDDRLQRMAGRRVSPETFTHGSSAQRVAAFRRGLESGDPQACGVR